MKKIFLVFISIWLASTCKANNDDTAFLPKNTFSISLGFNLNYNWTIESTGEKPIKPFFMPTPAISLNYIRMLSKEKDLYIFSGIGFVNISNATRTKLNIFRGSEAWNTNEGYYEENSPEGIYTYSTHSYNYWSGHNYLTSNFQFRKLYTIPKWKRTKLNTQIGIATFWKNRARYYEETDFLYFSNEDFSNNVMVFYMLMKEKKGRLAYHNIQCKIGFAQRNRKIEKLQSWEYNLILNCGLNTYGEGYYIYSNTGKGDGFGTLKRNTNFIGFEVCYGFKP